MQNLTDDSVWFINSSLLAGLLCHTENPESHQLSEKDTSQMERLICSPTGTLWNKSLLGFPTDQANFPKHIICILWLLIIYLYWKGAKMSMFRCIYQDLA